MAMKTFSFFALLILVTSSTTQAQTKLDSSKYFFTPHLEKFVGNYLIKAFVMFDYDLPNQRLRHTFSVSTEDSFTVYKPVYKWNETDDGGMHKLDTTTFAMSPIYFEQAWYVSNDTSIFLKDKVGLFHYLLDNRVDFYFANRDTETSLDTLFFQTLHNFQAEGDSLTMIIEYSKFPGSWTNSRIGYKHYFSLFLQLDNSDDVDFEEGFVFTDFFGFLHHGYKRKNFEPNLLTNIDFIMVGHFYNGVAYGDTAFYSLATNAEKIPKPETYQLLSVYPNPFNPVATVAVEVAFPSAVSVSVWDLTGRNVAQLAENQRLSAGKHLFSLDGTRLSSGVYVVRVLAGNRQEMKKITLLK
jgi:hypothetical protein